MDVLDLFEKLALALAIGLLIGVERGWREREGERGSRTAGIRTFALIAFLGGVMAALTPMAGSWPLTVIGFAFALAFAFFKWRENINEGDYSVTSVIVAILTYALGAYAVLGEASVAVAAAVGATAVLAARQTLHDFLRRLTWAELRSAILLLAMTFLLLPILPRQPVDPWDILVPYELWLFIVILAGVSFAGYAAVRILGKRIGLAVAAAAGALVSSTAVTMNNARIARRVETGSEELAGAVCVAWIVSILRVCAIAGALNSALLGFLVPAIFGTAVVWVLSVLYYYWKSETARYDGAPLLQNPIDLSAVLAFGALLLVVLSAAKILSDQFGASGLFALAAISGAVDVDPVTLSAARIAGDTVSLSNAVLAILIAVAANTIGKTIIAASLGGRRFALLLAVPGGLGLAAGFALWFAVGSFA